MCIVLYISIRYECSKGRGYRTLNHIIDIIIIYNILLLLLLLFIYYFFYRYVYLSVNLTKFKLTNDMNNK